MRYTKNIYNIQSTIYNIYEIYNIIHNTIQYTHYNIKIYNIIITNTHINIINNTTTRIFAQ